MPTGHPRDTNWTAGRTINVVVTRSDKRAALVRPDGSWRIWGTQLPDGATQLPDGATRRRHDLYED